MRAALRRRRVAYIGRYRCIGLEFLHLTRLSVTLGLLNDIMDSISAPLSRGAGDLHIYTKGLWSLIYTHDVHRRWGSVFWRSWARVIRGCLPVIGRPNTDILHHGPPPAYAHG